MMFSKKDLWKLVWPLFVEQLLQITLGIADVMMIASLGEEAVSSVSLVHQINVLLTQIFTALATGGAVVCSQYIGSGNKMMAEKTAKQLLYTVSAISITLMTIGLFLHKTLLAAIFGEVDYEVMKMSQVYFFITLFSLPGIALYSSCAALFRAQGNSKISMKIALLVNALNVGGNAVMLFVFKRGVEGVAVPTALSQIVAAMVLLFLLYKSKNISIKGISKITLDYNIIGKILRIGIPNGLENSTFQVGKVLVLSLISSYGTVAIAANSVTNTIASLQVIAGSSIGLALLPVVGQCMGARETEQAKSYTRRLMFIAYVGFSLVNVPVLIFIHNIVSLYNLTPDTAKLAAIMSVSHGAVGMLLWPASFTLPNALRAAGDASFTMIVSMISMIVIRVGMSYVFKWTNLLGIPEKLGWPLSYCAEGIWIAMFMDWIFRSSFFVARFVSGKWLQKKVI